MASNFSSVGKYEWKDIRLQYHGVVYLGWEHDLFQSNDNVLKLVFLFLMWSFDLANMYRTLPVCLYPRVYKNITENIA